MNTNNIISNIEVEIGYTTYTLIMLTMQINSADGQLQQLMMNTGIIYQ